MPREVAKKYISEMKRVCHGIIYASLISRDEHMSSDDFVVTADHEKGTFQTVFDAEKIYDLFGANSKHFSYLASVEHVDILKNNLVAKRYYCVIKSDLVNETR